MNRHQKNWRRSSSTSKESEYDESRNAAQEKLHEICEELRAQVDKLCEKINSELEEKFIKEDNRLQTILSGLRSDEDEDSEEDPEGKDRTPR